MSGENKKLNEGLIKLIRWEKGEASVRFKKLRYFVALGADVNTKLYGKSALSWAKAIGDEEMVQFLREKGASEWEIEKEKSIKLGEQLIEAIGVVDNEKVYELLKDGAEVNLKNSDGESALLEACVFKEIAIVKELLMMGCDVDIKNDRGETALMMVVNMGDGEVVKDLIKKGADLEAKDNEGATALMRAAWNGKKEMVKVLIENGVDINAMDNNGKTAIDWAEAMGFDDVSAMLRKALKEKDNVSRGDKNISIEFGR